jgi:hypothetical protein
MYTTNKENNMKISNLKDGKRIPVMHGENFLVPIDTMPEGDVTRTKVYIAGHSETGHHHVLESKAEMEVVEGETRAVLLSEVGKLFHQKTFDIHETLFLAPGAYEITHKTEYDPFQQVIRAVWD